MELFKCDYELDNENYESFITHLRDKDYDVNPNPSLYSSLPRLTNTDSNLRLGKWSALEDATLLKNWENFLNDYPWVKGNELILFLSKKWNCSREVFCFIKKTRMYDRLACNINRGIKNVYWRAKKCLLVKKSYSSERASTEEILKCLELYKKHGPKYSEIGGLLNRRGDWVRETILKHAQTRNTSFWLLNEEKALILAIYRIKYPQKFKKLCPEAYVTFSLSLNLPIKGEKIVKRLLRSDLSKISWVDVSHLVETRKFRQCRSHWYDTLSSKLREATYVSEIFRYVPNNNPHTYQNHEPSKSILYNPEISPETKHGISIKDLNSTTTSNCSPICKKNSIIVDDSFDNVSTEDEIDDSMIDDTPIPRRRHQMEERIRLLLLFRDDLKGNFDHETKVTWELVVSLLGLDASDLPNVKKSYYNMKTRTIKNIRMEPKALKRFLQSPLAKTILTSNQIEIASTPATNIDLLPYEEYLKLPGPKQEALKRAYFENCYTFDKLIEKMCKKYARKIEVYSIKQSQAEDGVSNEE